MKRYIGWLDKGYFYSIFRLRVLLHLPPNGAGLWNELKCFLSHYAVSDELQSELGKAHGIVTTDVP